MKLRSAGALGGLLLVSYGILVLPHHSIDWLTHEDHLFENLGFFGALVAGIVFSSGYFATRRSPRLRPESVKHASLLVLGIVFLVLAGEEISWGNRLLDFANSSAHDPTLHNDTGGLGDTLQRLFKAAWLLYAGVLPVLVVASASLRRRAQRLVPLVPLWIAPAVLINQVLRVVLALPALRGHYYHPELGFPLFNLDEVFETDFEVMAAITALVIMRPRLEGRRERAALAAGAVACVGLSAAPGRFTPLALIVVAVALTPLLWRRLAPGPGREQPSRATEVGESASPAPSRHAGSASPPHPR